MNKITKKKIKSVSNKKLKKLHSKNKKKGGTGEPTLGIPGQEMEQPPPIPNVPPTFFGKDLSQEQHNDTRQIFEQAEQDWNFNNKGLGLLSKKRMKEYFKKLIINLEIQQNKYTKLNSIIHKGKSVNEIRSKIFKEATGLNPELLELSPSIGNPNNLQNGENRSISNRSPNNNPNNQQIPQIEQFNPIPTNQETQPNNNVNKKPLNKEGINNKLQTIINNLVNNLNKKIIIESDSPDDILKSINDANLLGDFNKELYKFFNNQFSAQEPDKKVHDQKLMINNKFNQLLYTQVVNGKLNKTHPSKVQKEHLIESLQNYDPSNNGNGTNRENGSILNRSPRKVKFANEHGKKLEKTNGKGYNEQNKPLNK